MKEGMCKTLPIICDGSIRPRPAGVTFDDCIEEAIKDANQPMAQMTTDCECQVKTCGASTKSNHDAEKLTKTVKKHAAVSDEASSSKIAVMSITAVLAGI